MATAAGKRRAGRPAHARREGGNRRPPEGGRGGGSGVRETRGGSRGRAAGMRSPAARLDGGGGSQSRGALLHTGREAARRGLRGP